MTAVSPDLVRRIDPPRETLRARPSGVGTAAAARTLGIGLALAPTGHVPRGDTAMRLIGPLVLAVLGAVSLSGCQARSEMLRLDYDAFDQRPGSGWRPLAAERDYLGAARLIDRYLEAHADLPEWQRVNLAFHAGQMYAHAGLTAEAIRRFESSFFATEPPGPIRWHAYIGATMAFLRKDKARLLACREEIAAGPRMPDGEVANLNIVDALIENFDRPYAEAYTAQRKTGP